MTLTISLPDGRGLGGVTTWAAGLAERWHVRGEPVRLIEHASSRRGVLASVEVATVDLSDRPHPNHPFLARRDIDVFRAAYTPSGPTVFVPNWSWGTYAAATSFVRDDPERHQIVAMVHADGPDYYEWIQYYEAAVSGFVAVSEEIAGRVRTLLPHRVDDITVLPYAVDVPVVPSKRRPLRDRPLEIVYAGRLSIVQKRVLDLLAVAEILEARGVDFSMRIIGTGPDEAVLDARIDQLSVNVRRRLHREAAARPDQMADVWAASDVFLLTSDYEGTSIAMLEAMGQGSVPVVTNVSGVAAVIEHGVSGLVAPIGDVECLADHLEQLSSDSELLHRMHGAAHAAASSRPGIAAYDAAFARVLANAASQPACWPDSRPLLPAARERAGMGDVVAGLKGDRDALKRLAFFAGALPGVSALRWVTPLAKRLLHRRAR